MESKLSQLYNKKEKERQKGEEGDRGDLGDKIEHQKGREQSSQ